MALSAPSLRSTKPRQRSSLPRLRLGSITELPELASPREVSPVDRHSSSARSWSFDASVTSARASSFQRKKKATPKGPVLKRESRDRECGICFEPAMNPRRTRCCGQLFCSEHLADWLGGHKKNGSCPSCQASCCINQNTVSLAPPPKPTTRRSPPKLVLKPRESVEPSMSWLSWSSPVTARDQFIDSDMSADGFSGTSSESSSQHSPGSDSSGTSSESSSSQSSRSSSPPLPSGSSSRSPSPPSYSVTLPFTTSSIVSSFMNTSKPDVKSPSACRTRLTHRSGSWGLLPPYFTSRLSKYITIPSSAPGAEDIGNILLSLAFLLTVFVALACINDVAEYYLE